MISFLSTISFWNQNRRDLNKKKGFISLPPVHCRDALHREESCGGHFRDEHQTEDNEARRDDDNFRYAAGWEFAGVGEEPVLHKEPLEFEEVELTTRSYK